MVLLNTNGDALLKLPLVCAIFLGFNLYAQEVLTNETVLKMVKAGLSDDLIVVMVNNQAGKYSLDSDALVGMKQSGVSDRLLSAMVGKNGALVAPPAPAPKPSAPTARDTFGEWRAWPSLLKLGYVAGFSNKFQIDCLLEHDANPPSLYGSKPFGTAIHCPANGILNDDSVTMGQIADGVEDLYKDRRNQGIFLVEAVEYVIFLLDGTPSDYMQHYLNVLRTPATK